MENIQIFVEGVADQKFFQDIIEAWYNEKLTLGGYQKDKTVHGQIFSVGGKGVFKNEDKMKVLDTIFKANRISGVKNIFIFDADEFVIESKNFVEYSKIHPIQYFLLPDNQSDGDLETLLVQIINQENKVIFDCWEGYENCLKTSNGKEGVFTTPASKTKIYAYLEALLGESDSQKKKIKEAERNYQDATHWDLNAPALVNLKQFLDQYFQELP
jgi:hypothetical protein